MKLKDHTRESLVAYLTAQCAHIVPDGREGEFRKAADETRYSQLVLFQGASQLRFKRIE